MKDGSWLLRFTSDPPRPGAEHGWMFGVRGLSPGAGRLIFHQFRGPRSRSSACRSTNLMSSKIFASPEHTKRCRSAATTASRDSSCVALSGVGLHPLHDRLLRRRCRETVRDQRFAESSTPLWSCCTRCVDDQPDALGSRAGGQLLRPVDRHVLGAEAGAFFRRDLVRLLDNQVDDAARVLEQRLREIDEEALRPPASKSAMSMIEAAAGPSRRAGRSPCRPRSAAPRGRAGRRGS